METRDAIERIRTTIKEQIEDYQRSLGLGNCEDYISYKYSVGVLHGLGESLTLLNKAIEDSFTEDEEE